MRIIAGEKRGFILKVPRGNSTRPTLSRIRESVFSILGTDVIDARVLDLYAGAGGFGLEALSRGAAHCDFIERAHAAIEALVDNVRKLGYGDCAGIHHCDARRWLRRDHSAAPPYSLVFTDPPYHDGEAQKSLEELEEYLPLAPSGVVVVQSGSRENVAKECGNLRCVRHERYGDTAVRFFVMQNPQ
jgi:16S rRNA (guanine(966)-N(2))-methyltransferase RsmD